MKPQARKSPGFLSDAIVYQVFLRTFTPEGTLKSAVGMLPHVAEMGVDAVYLCPVFLQDDDPRTEFWSDRQNKSGIGNPQNPYRIKDYFTIDPEYGTDDDLRRFVDTCHALGMKVLLDLVYYHCGPTAVFIDEHPDFVRRDENGAVINGRWHFPELNFECAELREYLWENMAYFIREFNVDGYRCDVAPAVPLDFWEEGRRRMESLNPDFIMISEGDKAEDQLEAFDLGYAFAWEYALMKTFRKEINATDLRETWQKMYDEYPEGSRFLRILDNHDVAMDCGSNRHEIAFGNAGVDAALLINFTIDGVPFIYNGQEVADSALHSIYSNRFYGKMCVDWSNAMTQVGKQRLDFIKTMIRIRRDNSALNSGLTRWLDSNQPETLAAFIREQGTQKLLIAVNTSNQNLSASLRLENAPAFPQTLLEKNSSFAVSENQLTLNLLPYGFTIIKL